MPTTTPSPDSEWIDAGWLAEVVGIARRAGREILDVYGTDFETRSKADDSPLTEADLRNPQKVHVSLDGPSDPENWFQEEDVLDTWASSWLWPFATMGWPAETETLRKFYPTTDLVTGPDIIFFWVARMIMAGYEFRGVSRYAVTTTVLSRPAACTVIVRVTADSTPARSAASTR